MRLLIVSSEFRPGPGGIGTHAHQLAVNLARMGWQIRVLAPQDYSSEDEIRNFNACQPFEVVRMMRRPEGVLFTAIHRLKMLVESIDQWRPDVLLVSGLSPVRLVAALAFFHNRPWVAIGHGTEFTVRNFWQQKTVCWAYSQANAVICVSNFTQNIMHKLGVKPRVATIIHNGADHERFGLLSDDHKRIYFQKIGLASYPILLTVGSVTDRKGQEIVIRALPEILKEFPNAHYLMAGLPVEQRKLNALAKDLGIESHIHFLGRVEDNDLVGYLNCCDLFLMTSRFIPDVDCEGFGIAVVEAALCGKPAIVSADSGLTEAIVDWQTGIIVPDGDVHATAEAALKLLRDSQLRESMGKAAYSYSRGEQTWQNKGAEYDRLLRELLSNTLRTSHPV